MNNLLTFANKEFGKLRTIEIDNFTYFVGKDVAKALGYANINKAIQTHVDDEDKITLDFKGYSQNGKSLWAVKTSIVTFMIQAQSNPRQVMR